MVHEDIRLIDVPGTMGTARGHFGDGTVSYGIFQISYTLLLSFLKFIRLLFFQIKYYQI